MKITHSMYNKMFLSFYESSFSNSKIEIPFCTSSTFHISTCLYGKYYLTIAQIKIFGTCPSFNIVITLFDTFIKIICDRKYPMHLPTKPCVTWSNFQLFFPFSKYLCLLVLMFIIFQILSFSCLLKILILPFHFKTPCFIWSTEI